jgi:hypothetical protein
VSAGEKMLLVPEAAALDGASAIGAIGDGMAVGLEAEDGWEERVRQLKPPPDGTAIVVPFDLTPRDYTIEGWRQAYANAVRLNVQLRAERDATVADRDDEREALRLSLRQVDDISESLRAERDALRSENLHARNALGVAADQITKLEAERDATLKLASDERDEALARETALRAERDAAAAESAKLRLRCDLLEGEVGILKGPDRPVFAEVARLRQALGAVGKLCAIVESLRVELRADVHGVSKALDVLSEGPLDEIAKIASSVGVAPEGPLDEIAKIIDPHAVGKECSRPDCWCHPRWP